MLIFGNLPSYNPPKILTLSKKPTDGHETPYRDATTSSRRTEEAQPAKPCSRLLRTPSRSDDGKVSGGICVWGFEVGVVLIIWHWGECCGSLSSWNDIDTYIRSKGIVKTE